MRRLVFVNSFLLLAAVCIAPALAAKLQPSADPVTHFITVADSVARAAGDDGLAAFVADNADLVGASVATLLDVAFQVAQGGDAAAAADNVALAKRVANVHEARGGTPVARSLVSRYEKWTPAQRKSRARAVALEAESVETRKAGDIPKAVALLDQARAIYEKIDDAHAIAVNWGTRGLTNSIAGDWSLVLKDYEKALPARRAVEDRILEGRTLNGMGTAYQQTGDFPRSIEHYQQAIAVREKTGDLGGLGTSLTFLGHTYNLAGRYVQARDCYEKALPILEQQGSPQQMVEILSGIALLNYEMGRPGDAEAAFLRAIDIAAKNELGGPEATLRRNLAENQRRQGRYAEALANLDTAWKLLEKHPDPTEQALVLSTRGSVYTMIGESEIARENFLAFAEVAGTLENPSYAAVAQRNIAQFYLDIGANDRSVDASKKAIALAEKAGDGREYRESLLLLGDGQVRMGKFEDALVSFQEALAQDQQDRAEAAILEDEIGIAGVLASMGRTEEARDRLRGLRPLMRASGVTHHETAALFAMGQSFEKESPDSAAYYYDNAIASMERREAAVGAAEVRTGFLSGVRGRFYEEVIRYYASIYAATGDARWSKHAFVTAERAKARGLLDMLQASVADHATPAEGKLLDQLYSLDPKGENYATERAQIEARYVDVRRARVATAMGGLSRAAVLELDAVMASLPNKTVMLEYALGDSASYVWIVDRSGHDLVKLPPRRAIESQVRQLRDALTNVDGDRTALLAASRAVYRSIVAPASARLSKAESAIIVPHGALFELPFEVLLTEDPANGGWNEQPFLMRDVTTIYAPSATIYASLKSASGDASFARDLLAVGNPDFTTLSPNSGPALAPLPFAAEEVNAVAAAVKKDRKLVLTGQDAREATVKREMKNGAPRVMHFATHGLVDATEPERSSVVFAAGDDEDGYFHTLEILATPVRSRLVVMSACESARGKISRGEGVVGLSRAFLASGAGSVVASLWAVSDESTAELMKAFYDRMLGKKRSASRALNEARLALIESDTYSHPFYWSPFVVTGTERSPW